jgi:hypothetical protein
VVEPAELHYSNTPILRYSITPLLAGKDAGSPGKFW